VPADVRIVDLKARRVMTSLPGLVRYLRRERPEALLSAMHHANTVAIWARQISGVPTRILVSIHNTTSVSLHKARHLRANLLSYLAGRFYPYADAIIAVSKGVAEDFSNISGIPLDRINIIYNPVVVPELFERAKEQIEHPWFAPGQPPVILGVGRLTRQKDFQTLIRAFEIVRRERFVRLVILGEGEERPQLETMIKELGLEEDVALPGFVTNPYAYMARAAVFVLSSAWEGLPTVLIEALACGCPVVSTDCPSGPAEILKNGKYGLLVPVGDTFALGKAITKTLETPLKCNVDISSYTLYSAVEQYGKVLGVKI
jgi:glycosyltransferase involved in cell wall biosynthesis